MDRGDRGFKTDGHRPYVRRVSSNRRAYFCEGQCESRSQELCFEDKINRGTEREICSGNIVNVDVKEGGEKSRRETEQVARSFDPVQMFAITEPLSARLFTAHHSIIYRHNIDQ